MERPTTRWALVAVAVAMAVPLLWPGDVPFIHDEPKLMVLAVDANAAGRLAPLGLLGTFGFTYGPLPVWLYQGLLATTRDLVSVAFAHTAVLSVITGAALWMLARALGLWAGFAAVPLLTPYFWFYARVLWDNTLLLPLAALAYAGYAAFLARGSATGLRMAALAVLAVPLVHLMGLSLVVPLVLHALVVKFHEVRRHAVSLAAIGLAMAWLAWPYWRYLAGPRPDVPGSPVSVLGWIFPLAGARLLGSQGLDYFYGAATVDGPVFAATGWLSIVPYLLVWGGIVVAIAMTRQARRTSTWTPRAHMASIAVASLAMQSVVHGLSGKFEHPHYQNGTWIATVLLAWLALDALASRASTRRLAVAVTALVLATNAAALSTLAWRIHDGHGVRNDLYGPSLAEQQVVARILAPLSPDSPLDTRVDLWIRFPDTLATLRALQPVPAGERPRANVVLDYASTDPRRADVRVIVR
ncbi:MAG: hypothetical protein U0P30_10390 [Vicinamibacterales bacterium]